MPAARATWVGAYAVSFHAKLRYTKDCPQDRLDVKWLKAKRR